MIIFNSPSLFPPETTQIIGMSATLGNIKDLQTFLRAENYTNDFRPVSDFEAILCYVCFPESATIKWQYLFSFLKQSFVCRTCKTVSIQVQLMEYVKLHDTIYEVVPKEEECFRFSRLLNFKVSSMGISWKRDALTPINTVLVCKNSNGRTFYFSLIFCMENGIKEAFRRKYLS